MKSLIILWVLLVVTVLPSIGQFTSSNLPIIIIDTDAAADITKVRIDASMKVVFNLDQRNQVTGPYNNYDGLISIKGRGSSSWEQYEKKGYSFETRLITGENNNVSLLGMPVENDWVLHGPYADKTLMKNAFVYKLGSELGRYTPRNHFCELVINGQYRGVYLLVEKIKRDQNRLDIATLNPEEISGDDLTGGYILRIDRQDDEYWNPLIDFGFGLSFYNYYYPDPGLMPQVQKDYIRNYVTDFELSLLQKPFSDKINGYRSYIDLSSFIDYFIINELTKNIDAYRLSAYMYKDKDSNGGKLTMGPLWDYNLSCGGVNIGFGDWPTTAENWVHEELPGGVPFWWATFLEDTYYTSCFKKRWVELREGVISESNISSIIDGYANLLDEAKDRNFEIFPLEEAVWGNNHSGFTYQQEIDTLKGFLRERIKWMDQEIVMLPGDEVCYECFACPPDIILGVEDPSYNFEIYPNPAMYSVTLQFNLSSYSTAQFVLQDIFGRTVKTQNFDLSEGLQTLEIDLSDIKGSGTFIYSLSTPYQSLGYGRLIKN